MKAKWLDSLDPNVVFFSLAGIAILFLFMCGTVWSQSDKPTAPTPPGLPGMTAAASVDIPLTPDEATAYELNQTKIEKLDLQVQVLQQQIYTQRKQLTDQTADLTIKFAEDHKIDATKYHLDRQKAAFVANAPPPPAAPSKPPAKGGPHE